MGARVAHDQVDRVRAQPVGERRQRAQRPHVPAVTQQQHAGLGVLLGERVAGRERHPVPAAAELLRDGEREVLVVLVGPAEEQHVPGRCHGGLPWTASPPTLGPRALGLLETGWSMLAATAAMRYVDRPGFAAYSARLSTSASNRPSSCACTTSDGQVAQLRVAVLGGALERVERLLGVVGEMAHQHALRAADDRAGAQCRLQLARPAGGCRGRARRCRTRPRR